VDDPEKDELSFVSVSSVKTVVLDASIDERANLMTLKFNGRGDSQMTVEIADATGTPYSYTFVVKNPDLPQLNIFLRLWGAIQTNMLVFWIVLAIIILLIIILIIVIATVRKKKRIRAEIEALLVSEMELEEQMLRLAASPAPTYYQSYGYLSPTQNIQQNPQFMLGGGGTQQPPVGGGMMLNAGQGSGPAQPGGQPLHGSYNSIPEFDDDDL
jgi:type II secretory pathway pseudopilin PulG